MRARMDLNWSSKWERTLIDLESWFFSTWTQWDFPKPKLWLLLRAKRYQASMVRLGVELILNHGKSLNKKRAHCNVLNLSKLNYSLRRAGIAMTRTHNKRIWERESEKLMWIDDTQCLYASIHAKIICESSKFIANSWLSTIKFFSLGISKLH